VLFQQLVDEDLGCACYLVGDEAAGVCVVVDPPLHVEPVLGEAERRGLRIERVLETHTHADHVSGHGRLALEHAVPVSIHHAADPDYPFEPVEDGDVVEVGAVAVTCLHTPGHRPEHCAFAVADRTRSDEPWFVLTGDSLFVGDAARPDLAVEAREGARGLYRSLGRLLALPDGVEVYPGHVAGSLCGAAMSSKSSTTIGFERRFNPLLTLGGEDEFVEASTGSAGVRPPNVERVVALNRGPWVAAPAPPGPVAGAGGAVVLDVRPATVHAAGHVRGSINVPVSGSAFGTKAGFVLPLDRPIVLHAENADEALLAARRLAAVGFLELGGVLERAEATDRTAPVDLEELERLLAEDAVDLIDVREIDEHDDGYIPGSRHVPYRILGELSDGLGSKPVVTICETGSRAAIAASVLQARGIEARPVLEGGVAGWRARGNTTVEFRRCG
jgi:glyoxylase-like metal-dependent hydrolase (beta-lactamase superfamily II)/rhodanese-related sulfurtransferase